MKKYELKVYPKGMVRKAYRVIEICGKDTLARLCEVIMDGFDFIDEHLYEFCIDHGPYEEGNYHRQPDGPGEKSADIALNRLGLINGQNFFLHYDFGDDWLFVIHVQKVMETDSYASPAIVRSKGEVEQYPDWDDDDWEEE